MSRTVIAGCGIAGATAACALKELLPEEEIFLIDHESCGLYSRIRIPEVLAGKLPEEKLILTSCCALNEKGIQTLLSTELEALDTEKKIVYYTGGSMPYDRFVFATGAEPSLPPIPGLEQTMTLRNIKDLHRIETSLVNAENALVIGGGLLGLEIAESLKTKGVKVIVSEIADRLLPNILNEKEEEEMKMNKKRYETGNQTFGSFFLCEDPALYSAVHRNDDLYIHLRCGGRFLCVQFCGQDALCGGKLCFPVFDDSGIAWIHGWYRRQCAHLQNHGGRG